MGNRSNLLYHFSDSMEKRKSQNKMTEIRTIKKLVNEQLITVEMSSIKKGDKFKMFELGKLYTFNNISLFEATSDAYKQDGIWGVDVNMNVKYS